MADDLTSKMTGEAEIEDVFALAGRGQVLVLKEGFRGTIHSNGTVRSDKGTAAYIGPEHLDSVGEGKSWLGVIVDPSVKELFARGQRVTFYRKH
jgi:hypothetical protein